MLYACDQRFNVMGNLENFCELKQSLNCSQSYFAAGLLLSRARRRVWLGVARRTAARPRGGDLFARAACSADSSPTQHKPVMRVGLTSSGFRCHYMRSKT